MTAAPSSSSPLLFSPDDHVVEPPWLFERHLPKKHLNNDEAPRIKHEKGQLAFRDGRYVYEQSEEGQPCDVWVYEGKSFSTPRTSAAAGLADGHTDNAPMSFEAMRPGFYERDARLSDMEVAGIGASVCFPNQFVRFCGQRFNEAHDKDLALGCVEAYNNFMVDEWCSGSGGKLVPLCIVPLWDPELAANEVRRNGARGARAVCFSELPSQLGLPSLHSGAWEPLFRACVDTQTVIMIHIGSSSRFSTTSEDAPGAVISTAAATNSTMALLDWIFSGIFVDMPTLRVCIAESQIGWVPYFLQRADQVWDGHRAYNDVWGKIPDPPSSYFRRNMACTFFDDDFGLASIDWIGRENVLFESDYPHGDSNWPNSLAVGREMTRDLDESTAKKVLWENAERLFGS